MRIILTHDRSDFDAIASQIGMLLLDPSAFAIRPLTVNANVQRFLDDHAASIPLVARSSVRGERIEHAWYVDTDRASDPKGMHPSTPRSLLDHHADSGRDDAADRWLEADVQAVGACATLVVERLIAADLQPDAAVATLLLLGIHEDTGSLRFRSTTRRDAEAAGWAIEVGARLDDLDRYLAKPLDGEARKILRLLVDDVSVEERGGHGVAVAAASAPDFTGEVAPLAGRMLVHEGVEAAIVLVDLGSIVQLSARSGTDAIDVGRLATAIGGGGHRRAAAATLEDSHYSLAEARAAVVALIAHGMADGDVLRVRDIMTRGDVVTLSADLSVGEALEIARRHGHEGYPVLDAGSLVAMVDRKDLDLAAHHGMLGLTLRQLIATARVIAEPDMPVGELIAMLQRRGAAHVPVVEGGALVGIVTRTDLIQHLSRRVLEPDQSVTSVPVAAAFDPVTTEALRAVADAARTAGRRVYLVGGIPRDLALERPIHADIDLVVDGDAAELGQHIVSALGGNLSVHPQFGTAKWSRDELQFDLVSARAEYYREPGALPIVQPGNLASDLRRRDFTINALAVALEGDDFGRLIDRFGGLEDLRSGMIRMLHPLSFVEDATRILRAVRFESRLRMAMSDDTERAAHAAVPHLDGISGARITAEMVKLFEERSVGRALQRLHSIGALDRIAPGADVSPETFRALRAAKIRWARIATAYRRSDAPAPSAHDLLLLWMATAGDRAIATAARLDLPRRSSDRLRDILRLIADERLRDGARPSERHAALQGVPLEAVASAAIIAPGHELLRTILRHAADRDPSEVPIDGADVRRLGVPEGPAIGRILERVRAAWLDGEIDDREAALRMATALLEAADDD